MRPAARGGGRACRTTATTRRSANGRPTAEEKSPQENLPLDFDVDPKKDILPWIGGEMGLAILPTDRHASDVEESDSPEPDVPAGQSTVIYDGPPLILTAATRNQNASDAFLTKLRTQMEKEGVRFEEAAY